MVIAIWLSLMLPVMASAAPYAALVMDARTGEVLHSRNADTRLHPASLTKMMTLYIAFQAIEHGEISLDTQVRVSKHAASEPPSKLGLIAGQRIELRYLIRAAAIKSANDAATAIGEALEGSEAAFARRMNRTAKALGMTRTTFKNANGLTEAGHLSTARDMSILGRHILYDYPQYYNLFSRRTANAKIKTVSNTNRRLLAAYEGADGIKTGYTRAAGFNLVASAKHGDKRIIATVFGGKSSTSRNAKVAELLDLGFRRAPGRAPLRRPPLPEYVARGHVRPSTGTTRVVGAVHKSLRPRTRPDAGAVDAVVASAAADEDRIQSGVEAVMAAVQSTAAAEAQTRPPARPVEMAQRLSVRPEPTQEVVTRIDTTRDRDWSINVGRFTTRYQAEKVLLRTALEEMATLDGTQRKVVRTSRGFDATFVGLSEERADLACRRLAARNKACNPQGPS